MSKENLIIAIIAEILEVEIEEVKLDTELTEDNWDSLAVVTFISEVDSEFDKVVTPKDVNDAKNVSDLINLV